LISCFI